jgi:PAS domain S-box-containing protein
VAAALAAEGGAAAAGSFANMAVVERHTGMVRVVFGVTHPGGTPAAKTFGLEASVPACDAIRGGLPVLLGSRQEILRRYPAVAAEISRAGLEARASLPLHSASGETLGAVGFGWSEPQEFSVAQLRRLDLIAQLAGLALDRAIDAGTRALETMPSAFLSMDPELRFTYVNPRGERLLGMSREELVGRSLFEAFPRAEGGTFAAHYHRALERRESVTFEAFYGSAESWFEVTAWPDPFGLNVSFANIDHRRRADEQRDAALSEAEQANARLSFLTEVSTRLAGANSRAEVFERLVRAVVPAMGRWCTLVVPEGETLVRVAAKHDDPALDALAQRLVGTYSHPFDGPSPGVTVYQSGETMRLDHLARDIARDLDDSAASAAYGRTLLLLGDGPGLIVPVRARRGDQVIAVLTLTRDLPFTDADVAVMEEVAVRAAGSLDDALHVENQRETASALQAAALPKSLPTGERLALAAGYRAASEGSQVGGDWYDAFELQNGRVALVVGDVAGHGLQAAAVMAQMRNALRANLFASFGPLDSIDRLTRLLATQEPDAFATVVCLEVDPVTGEATWASAGHPAPVLVRADGSSVYLRGQPRPPIGLEGPGGPGEHRLVLRPGERLLLYTDGLVERRGVDPDIGIAHLMILAEQTHGLSAQESCEAILFDMLAVSHEDDVCLLVADLEPLV